MPCWPGRFEARNLVLGVGYDLHFDPRAGGPSRPVARDVRVEPGPVLDLEIVRVDGGS